MDPGRYFRSVDDEYDMVGQFPDAAHEALCALADSRSNRIRYELAHPRGASQKYQVSRTSRQPLYPWSYAGPKLRAMLHTGGRRGRSHRPGITERHRHISPSPYADLHRARGDDLQEEKSV